MESTSSIFHPNSLRFEHRLPHDTLGLGASRPRLSWTLANAPPAFHQTKYQLELYDSNFKPASKSTKPYYSLEFASPQSTFVSWSVLDELKSRQGVWVRVRVAGTGTDASTAEQWSEWSAPAYAEAGLLERADWTCQRIAAGWTQDAAVARPEELYRKEFTLRAEKIVVRARLYITAQGLYEAEINGRRVGDHFLAPGWTAYKKRLLYQVYDVQALLEEGAGNCLGVRVAEGWFCGRLGWSGGRRNIWGERTALLAQLEVDYADGEREVIVSDDTWEVAEGPIRRSEIYDGEKYDCGYEIPGWSTTALQKSSSSVWSKADVLPPLPAETLLVEMEGAPIRRLQTVRPIEKITTPSGKCVIDFGQNLAGYTRIKQIKGRKGHKVSLYHAEVLEHGELGRRPLRVCEACDEYTLRGGGEGETWEPLFTFHGFRFVQVENWPAETEEDILNCLEAVVCHTEMAEVGTFTCSDPMLNRLHDNVRWSMRGNFLSVPTDCPQRDERMGWTGDLALFAPTAASLYDCAGMLSSWLEDVYIDQEAQGGIPALVTPNVLLGNKEWSKMQLCAIWNDVVILAPWALYEATGDLEILKRGYASMLSYLAKLPRNTGGGTRLWDPQVFQLGDWLDPAAPPDKPSEGKTDAQLVSNAFLVRCLDLMVKISAALGKEDDSAAFHADAGRARADFAAEYITPTGRMASDAQTAYALAITFDLLPSAAQRMRSGARLAELVRRAGFTIGTGFAGTPYVCEALVQTDQAQVAYRMLLERKCPSWLYPVTMGATTTWERWDSMVPDGSVNPGEMTSFNHYALGAVAAFLYERVGGLRGLEVGWRRCRAEPILGAHMSSARVSRATPFGVVECAWEIVGDVTNGETGTFNMTVNVPPETTMEVVLPAENGKDVRTVASGEHAFSVLYKAAYHWPPKAIGWNPNIAEE